MVDALDLPDDAWKALLNRATDAVAAAIDTTPEDGWPGGADVEYAAEALLAARNELRERGYRIVNGNVGG
jgi:hypothetical protein